MTTQQESNYLHNMCEGQKKENLNFVRKTIKLLPHCNKGVVILCAFQLLLHWKALSKDTHLGLLSLTLYFVWMYTWCIGSNPTQGS